MRTTTSRIVAAVVALVGATGTAVIAATVHRPMVPIAEAIGSAVKTLDTAIAEELRSGCVETDPSGKRVLCGRSKARVAALQDAAAAEEDALRARSPEHRVRAVETIARMQGPGARKADYRSTSTNPYRADGSLIETYADDQGREYWIDPRTDRIVQMGPAAGLDPQAPKARPETRLPVPELRRRATALAETNVPGFSDAKNSLHPLEDNKDKRVYFFRWDDFRTPTEESELPPFVQVALLADGTVVGFTDTLTR